MIDCLDERTSQRWRAPWRGFGPVKSSESVIFAVFHSTIREGQRLTSDSFDNKHLKTNAQSLARRRFVTRPTFDRTIVRDGVLQGIAVANVASIRALVADVKLNAGEISVRSLCILDRVEAGDCDGHATAGYSEQHTALGMSQTQLSKVRARIRLDLADTFSEILNPNGHRWATVWAVLFGRILSVGRVLRVFVRARLGG